MTKPKKKNPPIFAPASPKQELMFKTFMDVQVLIIGGAAGSGKSYLLQAMPLFLIDDPNSNCLMIRRTTPQITGQGGIWDTAKSLFHKFPKLKKPKIREKALEAEFPNGAKIKFQHMEREADKYNIQGLQFTFIGIDEATQLLWSQIEYCLSRLRSESHHFSRLVMSCNPDPDHEIRNLISWYLDDEGYPDQAKDGVIRYFIRKNGDFIWGSSAEELKAIYGEKCRPLSFSFVSANVYDNPPMMENNPDYVAFLEGLNEIDQAQLLHGNWNARAKGANYFERDWLPDIARRDLPRKKFGCRAYDLAATERSQVNKYPDFTTAIKMYKDNNGIFYIVGDYHKRFFDEPTQTSGRLAKRVGERDNIMIDQAKLDGSDITLVFPVDPSAAGKQVYSEMAKKFGAEGFRVKRDPAPTTKAKLTRFLPFADACENGLVRIVKDSFDPNTLEAIYKELEAFNGERSSSTRKDDFPDCIASAYNYLTTQNYTPTSELAAVLSGFASQSINKFQSIRNK